MNVFTRSRKGSSRTRFRPSLELLEGRDCPSSVVISAPTNTGVANAPLSAGTANVAGMWVSPNITLSCTNIGYRWVTLSGQVFDVSPGGVVVRFTGVYAGSTITNADGTFS